MGIKSIVFTAIVLGCAAALGANREFGLIGDQCLRCLCEASTECNEDAGCTRNGPNQYLCGPYAISYEYWKDGGSPGENPTNPLDFEKCLTYKPCAEATIKGYMNRFGQDCNGDGVIDCYDWALLHKAGPSGCSGSWAQKSDYFSQFKTCYGKQ